MYVEQFFWILVLLWSAISALFQYPTWLRALPDICAHFLPRWIPAWGLWEIDSTYYGVVPPLFLTPKELSSACAVAVVSLISGVTDVVILSFLLWHSSAPAINFVLGLSRENKVPIYSAWQTPATQPRGLSTFYLKWHTCTKVFFATLPLIATGWKQSKYATANQLTLMVRAYNHNLIQQLFLKVW